jgi:hypothetical protein
MFIPAITNSSFTSSFHSAPRSLRNLETILKYEIVKVMKLLQEYPWRSNSCLKPQLVYLQLAYSQGKSKQTDLLSIGSARIGIAHRRVGKHQKVMRIVVCTHRIGFRHTGTLTLILVRNAVEMPSQI